MECVEENVGQKEKTPVVQDNNSTSKDLRLP